MRLNKEHNVVSVAFYPVQDCFMLKIAFPPIVCWPQPEQNFVSDRPRLNILESDGVAQLLQFRDYGLRVFVIPESDQQ